MSDARRDAYVAVLTDADAMQPLFTRDGRDKAALAARSFNLTLEKAMLMADFPMQRFLERWQSEVEKIINQQHADEPAPPEVLAGVASKWAELRNGLTHRATEELGIGYGRIKSNQRAYALAMLVMVMMFAAGFAYAPWLFPLPDYTYLVAVRPWTVVIATLLAARAISLRFVARGSPP